MNNYIFCISLLVVLFSCQHESIQTRTLPSCVNTQERIMSRDTGFSVFNKGLQEKGYAQAIKINKPWEASISAILIQEQDIIVIIFKTYYTTEIYANNISEYITIEFFYNKIDKGCFRLEKNRPTDSSAQLVRIRYFSTQGDLTIDRYLVDEENDDSYLEIENIDLENGKISGRFMVTFLRESVHTPYTFNRPIVRFFNGYFEADLEIFTVG